MDLVTALEDGQRAFAERLALVTPDQLDRPSACRGWTVFGLVNHTVMSNRSYAALLAGEPREQATRLFLGEMTDEDLGAAYAAVAAEVRAGFGRPGALDRVYLHPTVDLPGEMLLALRILDDTAHAWDLARSIGADDRLPETALAVVWSFLEPNLAYLGGDGTLGRGPSGTLGPDASLQARVLDAVGRRP